MTPPPSTPTAPPPAARRPRIGVDFHTFDGLFQGSRSHLFGLYREAIAKAPAFDFVFFVGDPARLRSADPAFCAANVRCEAAPHGGGLARLGWQLRALQRHHGLDLLHVQYRGPLFPAGPLAVTVHDTLFETHPQFFGANFVRMARFTGRRAVRQAALLFTVSRFSRDEIARLYGIDPARIAITGNGVDTRRFHPAPGGEAAVQALGLASGGYLCTVGRLEPRKNHGGLIRAYARLPQPRPPLVVIGQRDFSHDEAFAEVARLGLAAEVRFLERVDDDALPALLRHAKVFVYPSFAEGFGMPVLEAMASGVPVLTSNTTALAEVAQGAALTADPADPAAIAAGLQRLLDDPALRAQCVRDGLAVAATHRWSTAADALVAAYSGYFAR